MIGCVNRKGYRCQLLELDCDCDDDDDDDDDDFDRR